MEGLEDKAEKLLNKIREAKGLQKLAPPKDLTPYWSLLTSTSWTLVSPKIGQVKTICTVALEEVEKEVLEARNTLLRSKYAMALRFDLWLTVNLWLRRNTTTLPGMSKPFTYWDQCPDSTVDLYGLYWGETGEKVSKLMAQDKQLLKELGDLLTTSLALTNNRDAPVLNRVISMEAKCKIDELLEVSENYRQCSQAF